MDEEHPLNPRSPYAAHEGRRRPPRLLVLVTYDLPIVIIRPFNNYGPYQHPEKVDPALHHEALTDQPLTIHGDGHASRDWLHVDDDAEAIAAAIEVPLERIAGEMINVATGVDVSVREIADALLDVARQAARR